MCINLLYNRIHKKRVIAVVVAFIPRFHRLSMVVPIITLSLSILLVNMLKLDTWVILLILY